MAETPLFPLADNLRPTTLDEYIGQAHLVGAGKIIRTFIQNKTINSMIFWGPPGTGKTTLSRILVKEMELPSVEFSATNSKIADIRVVMKQAGDVKQMSGTPLVLFVDEIHHFNRSIQDAFLPYVEKGDIILLGTTTENPSFKINRALLSRLKVLEVFALQPDDLQQVLQRGVDYLKEKTGTELQLNEAIRNIILHYSGGDCRRLLNLVELLYQMNPSGKPIDEEIVKEVIQKNVGGYDRTGDDRYRLISAFHKAVRNSDLDATLFWLYRMIEGGEDPVFILRRMIRICVEDIGFADPEALQVCLNAKASFEFLGSPEGDLFLGQAAVYLASAPKSNSLYKMEKKMRKLVDKYEKVQVPFHIVNASHQMAKDQGAGKGYIYAHDCPEKTSAMETLPPEVSESGFYKPNTMGFEKQIKERIDFWLRVKEKLRSKK